MIKVLIAYGTSEGQTARIAEHLAEVIQRQGPEAIPVEIKRSGSPPPDGYDAVIVGASVHMGKHQNCVRNFVRKHRAAIERVPSAFFSVSLASHDTSEKARAEAEGMSRSSSSRRAGVPARSVSSPALYSTPSTVSSPGGS